MRIEGNLTKWNDDRGFGFITSLHGGSEVFVHISAFPKDSHRPTIGERLSFEVEIDHNGKKRAKNLLCPARPNVRTSRQPTAYRRSKKLGFFGRIIPLVVIVLAVYGYSHYTSRITPQAAVAAPPGDLPVSPTDALPASSSFSCDGRTHCSQMTSCAEATFFLRNCPAVEMDGNNDGVPCEQQWCTNPFAK